MSNNNVEEIPSYFRLARNVSKFSDHRYKLGAVVTKGSRVISVGHNQTKTNPNAPFNGLHAEIKAIKTAGRIDFRGASIYVYRDKSNGCIGNSRPCKYCMSIIKKLGFKYIYYSVDEFPFWAVERVK